MQVDPVDITVSSWHMKHLIAACLSPCLNVFLRLLFEYIAVLTEPHELAFFKGLGLWWTSLWPNEFSVVHLPRCGHAQTYMKKSRSMQHPKPVRVAHVDKFPDKWKRGWGVNWF